VKIAKILNDYSARTLFATSKFTIISETSVVLQKARSKSSELESSESNNSSNSDALSEYFK